MYHRKLVAGILTALVVFTFAFSLSAGQYDLSFVQVAAWFCHQLGLPVLEDVQVSAQQEAVLMFIRSPRTLVGFMVGAGLLPQEPYCKDCLAILWLIPASLVFPVCYCRRRISHYAGS